MLICTLTQTRKGLCGAIFPVRAHKGQTIFRIAKAENLEYLPYGKNIEHFVMVCTFSFILETASYFLTMRLRVRSLGTVTQITVGIDRLHIRVRAHVNQCFP